MSGGALSAGTVSLGVKGDAKGFGAKLSDDIKGQGSFFSDIGKHIGGLITAGLGVAGIAGIGAVFKVGFDEAKDASAGIAQLTAGIKSTGNAAGVSVKGLTDLASSIQGMSGQTDDSIVAAEQLLLTFTNIKNVGPDKIFDQATQAAADMAAKMGGDASSNAIQLGKALNDPVKGVTALQRVGVSFTQAQKDQIAAMVKAGDTMGAQKIILGELQTEFGGAAKAAGDSLPGQLAKGQRAFEDLSQTVVESIVPIVTPAITGISSAIINATPGIKAFAEAFSKDLAGSITWVKEHKTAVEVAAGAVVALMMPALAAEATAWAKGAIAATKSTVTQVWAHYQVVGGWISQAAAAVSTGVTNGIIWAQLYTEAALGAARNVASHAFVAVSGWGAHAAAAVAAGVTTAGVWAEQALQAGIGAAKAIGGLLVVAGGWIATAATATASGITMAAAWVIGLGPVGWIIGGVIAVGAAFVVLYNKVGWFRDGVNAAWNGIKAGFAAVKDWLVGAWNSTVDFFTGLPSRIGAAFKAVAGFITAPFRLEFNGIAALWNKTIGGWHIDIPSWVPGLGGKGFTMPQIPTLAQGATVMPTPGGTVVRVAEAGRAESIVDTGKLNNLLDKAGNGVSVTNNIYEAVSAEATANQVTRRLVARGV